MLSLVLSITSKGTGSDHTLSTAAVSGEVVGVGTVTFEDGGTILDGTDTNFSSVFTNGDEIFIYKSDTITTAVSVSSVDTTGDVITTSTTHDYTTGDTIIVGGTTAPGGLVLDGIYYARVLSTTTIQLHPTPTDATNNTNRIDITSTGSTVTLRKISDIG